MRACVEKVDVLGWNLSLPCCEYKNKQLPMGVCNSPDIFKEQMNKLLQVFEFISVYIDYFFILTKSYCKNPLQKLELTVNELKKIWLKCDI